MTCTETACNGAIASDGYCNTCGAKAATASAPINNVQSQPARASATPVAGSVCGTDGCTGSFAADGYCNTCGLAARPSATATSNDPTQSDNLDGVTSASTVGLPSIAVPVAHDISTRASGSGPTARTRQSSDSSRSTSARSGIGAGIVTVASTTVGDPAESVMSEQRIAAALGEVPHDDRFCSSCGKAVGRTVDGAAGRVKGFCAHCRTPFDFVTNAPSLQAGELVAGQYEILGPLAHGGMGWVYLGRDQAVSGRWVVLKGLLNEDDPDAVAAAVAERRFLAQIEHANIVNIYNFVTHRDAGYIVMEMVGGESLNSKLKQRRVANNGLSDPLPVLDAIAYVLGILPAFGYLHSLGLVYNDLKPANIMAVGDDVKLIDVGAVMRADDNQAAIFGTEGFQAPEVAELGPSAASDLYTVGRTLAVLIIRFTYHKGAYQYALPGLGEEPLFAQWESLYRFLLRATAAHPDDRFVSAEEMSEQLTGVLREIAAVSEGRPRPTVSNHFRSDRLPRLLLSSSDEMDPALHDWRILPPARIDEDDPAAVFLLDLPDGGPEANAVAIKNAVESGQLAVTSELLLQYSWELIQLAGRLGHLSEQHQNPLELLATLEQNDPWNWRVWWYRSIAQMQMNLPEEAAEGFSRVWTELPGETAPKLAVALAAEHAGLFDRAQQLYDLVSSSDSSYVSGAFGLARCRLQASETEQAVQALNRVPATSAAHYDAQVAVARTLAGGSRDDVPTLDELSAASDTIDRLQLDASERASISAEIFEQALGGLRSGQIQSADLQLLGRPLTEMEIRRGLEETYRTQARLTSSPSQRIALIDRANRVRPWSLF